MHTNLDFPWQWPYCEKNEHAFFVINETEPAQKYIFPLTGHRLFLGETRWRRKRKLTYLDLDWRSIILSNMNFKV